MRSMDSHSGGSDDGGGGGGGGADVPKRLLTAGGGNVSLAQLRGGGPGGEGPSGGKKLVSLRSNDLMSRCAVWSIIQRDGPNHLGLWYNVLPEHQMALITSGLCVPFSSTDSTASGMHSSRKLRLTEAGASPGTQTQDASLGALYELVS